MQAEQKGTTMRPNPALIDDENPEWTKEEWSRAVRGSDFFTPEQLVSLQQSQAKMREERLLREKSLKRVSLILEQDIITRFKATGKGWQQRINDVLRKELPV
jgi:uncharacterized protein (DUF4415 family)